MKAIRGSIAMLLVCHFVINIETLVVSFNVENVEPKQKINEFLKLEPDIHLQRAHSQVIRRRLKLVDEPESPTSLPDTPAPFATSNSQQQQQQQYKCAKYCTCSSVTVLENTSPLTAAAGLSVIQQPIEQAPANRLADSDTRFANLTRAKCESAHFTDVLTIDWRTQIIHISLPIDKSRAVSNSSFDYAASMLPNKQLQDRLPLKSNQKADKTFENRFRMPRLARFTQLQEIVIINLKFEVCDSEVFKRGQKLRRLKWNSNQLREISRDCFRHLDKLIDLNLAHNQLSELESALFSNLASLKHLNLAHNRLSELAAHQFANLSQLQSLNLVGNSFKSINLHLLEPMQNSLRLLVLARNQIKSFVYLTMQPNPLAKSAANSTNKTQISQAQQQQPILGGAFFKNLIKLNVDFNRFERIKMLQLHRFFNIKFLSIRANQIGSIRDRAFDGRKLVELNLAQNKLQLISRCAFCNSTIKRLILADNNISLPLPALPASLAGPSSLTSGGQQNLASAQQLLAGDQLQTSADATLKPLYLNAASSASMLVLSQSIFGPLFNQLEYLDLSHNQNLGAQLESLLEPLLELQFLQLANTGLERSLPTPTLFKNLRQLKYLNLSSNGLDQVLSESVEPLLELEMLDLSRNQFNELDESLLITFDELPKLKYVNLGANPWFCSQCKISPLHDWTQRSPIFNATCLSQQQAGLLGSSLDEPIAPASDQDPKTLDDELESTAAIAAAAAAATNSANSDESNLNSGFVYRHSARGIQDYSLLTSSGADAPKANSDAGQANVDFDLILNLFDGSSMSNADDLSILKQLSGPNYEFAANVDGQPGGALESQTKKRQLSEQLLKSLATGEDDESIEQTMASLLAASQLYEAENNELVLRKHFMGHEFCLKCEFPSELRAFNLHELTPTDFKHCAGMGPRFAASEPKIGLTLAIVIIGALFCVIVIVIIMYRKKSNTYFPNEELAEQLESGAAGTRKAGQPMLSVSSDLDHEYRGDATDYSSPPMSQSYESYSQDDEDLDEEAEDEDEDEEEDEEEDEDEDEEDDEDEELDEDEDDEEGRSDEGTNGPPRDHDRDHSHGQMSGHGSGTSDGGEHSSNSKKQAAQDHHHQHHVTISEAKDGQHHEGTASNGATQHVSIVPINASSHHENQHSISSQTTNEASEKRRPPQANKSQSFVNQTPVALDQLDAKNLVERQKANNGHSLSMAERSAPPAQLSAAELNSRQQQPPPLIGKSAAETRPEMSKRSLQSSKLVQLANLAGSLHGQEQQSRVRSAQSRESPTRHQATHPSALKQSKTTAVGDLDPSLASTLPPLPADFRSAGSSPSNRTQPALTSPSPVPPPQSSVVPRPKYQHRQSSEHSTAGSVSFATQRATRQRQANHKASGATARAASERRERLMSQTICADVEQPLASIKSRIGHTNSVRVPSQQHLTSTKRAEDKPVIPLTIGRQTQVEPGQISPGEAREAADARQQLAQASAMDKRANWNGSASKSSCSSTSWSHHSDRDVMQPSRAPSMSRAARPNILTAGSRKPIDEADYDNIEAAFDILSPKSSPPTRLIAEKEERPDINFAAPRHQVIGGSRGATRPPASKLVAQHRAIALSPGESPPVARSQSNHRHHIKQPTSNFETGWNGEPPDREDSLALDEEESMDLAARLDELPSDLDDSEVEQFLAAGGERAAAVVGGAPVRSSAALELLDDEDNEQIQSLDQQQDEQHLSPLTLDSSNQLRNSHSTHSALTQTGSRDFD